MCHTIFIILYVGWMYHKLKKCLICRSSHQRCSREKAILKNFAIFTGKQLCYDVFNRVAGAGLKTCNCNKRDFSKGFSVNIRKILRRPIFKKICKQLLLQFLLLTVKNFFLRSFVLLLIQYLSSLQGPL